MKFIPNPEYKEARYEYRFLMSDGSIKNIPMPIRGNEIKNGEIVSIPPFLSIPEGTCDGDGQEEDDD